MARKHAEPFRVYVCNNWPCDGYTTRNAYYFEHYEEAQARYLQYVIAQVFETKLLMRVAFERYNEHTGKYHPMFEAFVNQTPESHGLKI